MYPAVGVTPTPAPAFPPPPPPPCPDSQWVWAEESGSWAVWMDHIPQNGEGLQSKPQGPSGRGGEIYNIGSGSWSWPDRSWGGRPWSTWGPVTVCWNPEEQQGPAF